MVSIVYECVFEVLYVVVNANINFQFLIVMERNAEYFFDLKRIILLACVSSVSTFDAFQI